MKRMIDNRIMCILVYTGYIIVSRFIFSYFYMRFSYNDYVICLIYSYNHSAKIELNDAIYLTTAIQNIIDEIVFAIFTSLLVHFVMSKKPDIILPEKLIIRKRTTYNQISLSLMVGNRNRYNLYDVQCYLTYSYIKDNISNRNGETHFVQSAPVINNYYRFSYDLHNFPESFFSTLLERKEVQLEENRFYVVLTGKSGFFHEDFIISKTYRFNEIVIAKESKKPIEYSAKLRKRKTHKRYVWSNIDAIIDYSEDERGRLIDEIRDLYARLLVERNENE